MGRAEKISGQAAQIRGAPRDGVAPHLRNTALPMAVMNIAHEWRREVMRSPIRTGRFGGFEPQAAKGLMSDAQQSLRKIAHYPAVP